MIAAKPPTADDHRAAMEEYTFASRGIVDAICRLEALTAPRFLVFPDGHLELQEPDYPDGIKEQLDLARGLLRELCDECFSRHGFKVDPV